MGLFKNAYASHEHSLRILNYIKEYDSLTDSLKVIADMGCGAGLDTKWWATLESRDDPPVFHNYTVYAVDKDISQIEPDVLALKNVIPIRGNFEERVIPRKVDLMWAHDSFHYAQNPFTCLESWKETINVNGMLVIAIPQTTYIKHGRIITNCHDSQYYSYNLLNLVYMLASSGFDCRDAYFYREPETPWLYAAVYATEHTSVPDITWYELAEKNLVNESIVNSLNKHGHVRLDDVIVSWLDKENYLISI